MVGESVFVKVKTEGEVTTLYWYLMLEGLELLHGSESTYRCILKWKVR